MSIQITEIMIKPVERQHGSPLLGFARVVLNGAFVVGGIRILDGQNGLFVSYPSELVDGKRRGICYPILKAVAVSMADRILEEYRKGVPA